MAPDRCAPPRHALVLSAGLGTRLHPLTRVRAKPAIPVAGVPMIRRIVDWLVRAGVDRIVVNLHHRPDTLTAVVGDGSDLGAQVRYSWEPVVLGTAGGPRQALALLEADTFLIVNGDTLTDVDLSALARAHAATRARVTLALAPRVEPDRYGGARLDAQGAVTGFVPRGPAAAGCHHFVGVQVVRADVFRDLPAGVPAVSVGGVYDTLLAHGDGAIRGFVSHARFFDVGTPEDYWNTSLALTEGDGFPSPGRRGHIDGSAHVTQSILWDEVVVERGCRLDQCIVTDGVHLAPNAAYRRVILRRNDGRVPEAFERLEGDLLVSPLPFEPRDPRVER